MPKGLTFLSELRVLKGFVIGKQRSRGHYSKLADLAVLQHLKKLSFHVDSTSDEAKRELDSFPQFRNLRSLLSVAWSSIYNARTRHFWRRVGVGHVSDTGTGTTRRIPVSGECLFFFFFASPTRHRHGFDMAPTRQ